MNLFKRHEEFREFAHSVLGVDITITPASDAVHITACKKDHLGWGRRRVIHITRWEIDQAKIDVISLNMLQAVKDVGGFDVLH